MSSAHYFVKNYNIRQVIDLMCYGTLYPHTLTSTQKITRMYMCVLRRRKQQTYGENRGDWQDFHQDIAVARDKFERLFEISETTAEFKQTLESYENMIRQNMDPTMLIKQCRPYSPTSGKYFVPKDEILSSDPFGYYSQKRVIGQRDPGYGYFYHPDFPMSAQVWHINPPFEYDDETNDEGFKQNE